MTEARSEDTPWPDVSVIIVSDYGGGEEKAWNDLRAALPAWAAQDYRGNVKYVLVESAQYAESIPADLFKTPPFLQLGTTDAKTSYELKNHGMRETRTAIVAIVDADCIPVPSWVRLMVEGFRAHPEAVAVSGVTTYPARTLMERVLGLLSRSYLDPGGPAMSRFLSGNAVGYVRERYLAHPLPEGLGAYASRIQSEAFRRDGGCFWFEPKMKVVHDFEGWRMERDHRLNTGYSTVITRLADPRLPWAWLIRRGRLAIPVISFGKWLNSIRDCFRCRHHYDVRWYEMPVALCIACVVQLLELPGMLAAYRGKAISSTQYR